MLLIGFNFELFGERYSKTKEITPFIEMYRKWFCVLLPKITNLYYNGFMFLSIVLIMEEVFMSFKYISYKTFLPHVQLSNCYYNRCY